MKSSNDVVPIIPGFAPDPSVVLIGETYFLVTSSFSLFPGLPVYASNDLASWRQIGNAISRTSQLSLSKSLTRLNIPEEGSGGETSLATGGLYAPTIRHFNGTTYILCTNVISRASEAKIELENFIIKTDDIWSNDWSDPVYFDFYGIDPSISFCDNGQVIVQGSAWEGDFVSMKAFAIDLETGKKLSPERTLWTGFSKIIPEGPHIYEKDSWFYLLAAEGGTAEGHRITIARSRDIWGPYEAYENNPILKVAEPDHCVGNNGHGELFQDKDGHWWIVYLGVRKDQGRYILGRESFLTAVEWPSGGWPRILPLAPGNHLHENMDTALPPKRWLQPSLSPSVDLVYIRDPELASYDVSVDGCNIAVRPSMSDLEDTSCRPISFIGKRQRSLSGRAVASVVVPQGGNNDIKFGLAYYKDEHRFARVFWSSHSGQVGWEVQNKAKAMRKASWARLEGVSQGTELEFQIQHTALALEFSVRIKGDRAGRVDSAWTVAGMIDTLVLTDPDFVGPVIGVFAVSEMDWLDEPIKFGGLAVD